MLTRSTRPGAGSRLSGMSIGTRISIGTSTGTASRNTEPQWKCSRRSSADDRAECRARRESRCPDRDRESSLLTVGEDRAQQRERRRHQHRAEEAERGAGRDQRLGGRGERGGDREHGEADRSDQQHAATAVAVARTAHSDEQSREHERIGVDDPELLCRCRRQVSRDRGQREAQHGVVDRDEQGRQHQHRQGEPGSARRARRCRCRCDRKICWVGVLRRRRVGHLLLVRHDGLLYRLVGIVTDMEPAPSRMGS